MCTILIKIVLCDFGSNKTLKLVPLKLELRTYGDVDPNYKIEHDETEYENILQYPVYDKM